MPTLTDDLRPDPTFGSSFVGILGTFPQPKEVIGVYPSLSATLSTFGQEIVLRRGDSLELAIQVQDDNDPPDKVSIAWSVLKFAVKLGAGHVPRRPVREIGNEGATILKRSYDPAEIEITSESNGQALIHIKKADTFDHPLGDTYRWDLELIKGIEHLENQPGTVKVQAGDAIIFGTGTDFPTTIGLGDLIHVQGRLVMIVDRVDQRCLRTDFKGWTSETLLDYNLFRGHSKTIAGGVWSCLTDVVV